MKLTRTLLQTITVVGFALGLTACAQPNWYKAGEWNYTHQNYSQALPQLLWSAEMGNHSAQYAVGYMYYSGLGTPQDDVLAFHWLTKAAKGGNQNAAIALQQIEGQLPAHLAHHKAHQHKTHQKPHHAAHKHSHAHHTPNIPAPSTEKKAQQLPPLPAPTRTQ